MRVEFLDSGVFWTGLAGIVATAVTAVVGQVAQSRRHMRELRLQRRQHRYDELREAYDGVLDTMGRQRTSIEFPPIGERLLGGRDAEGLGVALKAIALLDVVRAPDEVLASRQAFADLVEEAQGAKNRTAYRHQLSDAEQDFRKACADHLARVWPFDHDED